MILKIFAKKSRGYFIFHQFKVYIIFFALAMLFTCVGFFAVKQALPKTTVFSPQTTDALDQKRYVAAGDRAYVIGTTNGRFPPMGWHIKGEMGGVWTHPIKLLDGYWFALNGKKLPTAKRFTTQPGYIEMDFPQTEDFEVSRIEFAPDDLPVVLVGIRIRNPKPQSQKLTLTLVAQSELMAAYPWTDSKPQNAKVFNGKDKVAYNATTQTLTFWEPGRPWYALISASVQPVSGATGDPFWGLNSKSGKGVSGQFHWSLNLSSNEKKTIWVAVSGSHIGQKEAEDALHKALADPERLLQEKNSHRKTLLERTQVNLPDEMLQDAFDWGKLNLADLRRTVTDVQIRDIDEGQAYPPPVTTLSSLTGIGAGFPDYPWYFGTDGAYTTYALIASGQWDTAIAHLQAIRDVSRKVNGETGKVIHEVVTDGSVYFGTKDHLGNTNETAQFATAVELVWKWSGDNAFRDEMYDFIKDGLTHVTSKLDQDSDGWPEGNGMVERDGMGLEKLDVAAYTWQALKTLERMAQSKEDKITKDWSRNKADAMQAAFDKDWWMDKENLYADSLCNDWIDMCKKPDWQLQQHHWINATPMETLLAPTDHAVAALSRLESDTFTADNLGLYHTGVGGGLDGKGELKVWTLPNSVMAVAEANYGRPEQALKYIKAIAAHLALEMPGALPEILPSPKDRKSSKDKKWEGMFMQAWSSYGIQWPIIHHFLGIVPDVPAGRLSVVPQIPPSWDKLSVQDLRVGNGKIAVSAAKKEKQFTTTVLAPSGWKLTIGHTLAPGTAIVSVALDGVAVPYNAIAMKDTPRGYELYVETITTGSSQTLLVKVEK